MSKPEYLKRTINKERIDSQFLEEERSFRVYLPPGYNELLSYPVIYAQDGQDVFMFGRIATISNELILDHGVEPYIIVGIDVDKQKRTSEYSTVGSRNDAYKSFVAKELLPFVEQHYAVRTMAQDRVLLGDSLGGTVSLDLALDYPQLFQNIISLSGAYFKPTYEKLQTFYTLNDLNIWMIVGTKETAVETHIGTFDFVEWNRKTKESLIQKGADVTYAEEEGEHIWGFWQKQLPAAIKHYFLH
jgi:enterochelin esterase-like enzyme